MPRLWERTIEDHRRAVRDAVLDATAALAARRGPRSVTMSQVADETGIGRATLYKYFPNVESILLAWHDRQVAGHLEQLAGARDRAAGPAEALELVLGTYAQIAHERRRHGGTELAAFVHRGEHVAPALQRLHALLHDVLVAAVEDGDVRDDVPPDDLAAYCLHALGAAASMPSTDAARRLADVTLAGLRRQP